jgi:hypothetical protein
VEVSEDDFRVWMLGKAMPMVRPMVMRAQVQVGEALKELDTMGTLIKWFELEEKGKWTLGELGNE